MNRLPTALLALALLVASTAPAAACHDGSPLVLDLDRSGIFTTSVLNQPVRFDIDADGHAERIGWTNPETAEGLLWVDLNHNGRVDDGGELFGDASLLPTGEEMDNGFDALAVYDRPELGGDGDGLITHLDLIWGQLRVWLDENHDGVSQQQEISPLASWHVVAIELSYEERNEYDGALNAPLFVGRFWRRLPGPHPVLQEAQVADVFFLVAEDD